MFKEQTRFPKPQRTAVWNTEDIHRCCLRTGGQVKAKAICLPCWSSVCLTVITHTTVHMEQDSTAYNAICSCIYALRVKSPFYRCAQHLHSWRGGGGHWDSPPPKGFPSNSKVNVNLRAGGPSVAGLCRCCLQKTIYLKRGMSTSQCEERWNEQEVWKQNAHRPPSLGCLFLGNPLNKFTVL